MKLTIDRRCFRIECDNGKSYFDEIEVAYIEDVLGLKEDGDSINLVRFNASGLSCIGYLETKKKDQK